jgi:hypothetical protein
MKPTACGAIYFSLAVEESEHFRLVWAKHKYK